MILDHIEFSDGIDIPKNDIKLRAVYHVEKTATLDISERHDTVNDLKVELAKSIREQMIKDLSGYFDDSFDEKDVEYVATISHRQLENMRKLAELTKWMTVDEVEKALRAYEVLEDFAAMLKRE